MIDARDLAYILTFEVRNADTLAFMVLTLSLNIPGTHTATERPYLKSYFRAKLEETLNQVREEEKLDEQPYSVVMSEEHEVEVLQFV